MDAGRRHETPESETEGFISHGTSHSAHCPQILEWVPSKSVDYMGCFRGQARE